MQKKMIWNIFILSQRLIIEYLKDSFGFKKYGMNRHP